MNVMHPGRGYDRRAMCIRVFGPRPGPLFAPEQCKCAPGWASGREGKGGGFTLRIKVFGMEDFLKLESLIYSCAKKYLYANI